MIWHTVSQAAERVGLQPRTIRIWIRQGALQAYRHDVVPGVVFVAEDALLECYRAKRARGGHVGPRP